MRLLIIIACWISVNGWLEPPPDMSDSGSPSVGTSIETESELIPAVDQSVVKLNQKTQEDRICRTEACQTRAASMLQSMNTSADPCTDFFQYACGNWITFNPLPPDESKWGVLQQMQKQLFAKLRDLMEFSTTETSTARQKARQVYSACMDHVAIEEAGLKPFLQAQHEIIGSWPLLDPTWNSNNVDFLQAYGRLAREREAYVIVAYIQADPNNPQTNILFFDETTLGLSSKKIYTSPAAEPIRKAYRSLMKSLTLLYAEDVGAKVDNDSLDLQLKEIFDFEVELAKLCHTEEERRDTSKIFNKMLLSEFLDGFLNSSFSKLDMLNMMRSVPYNSSVSAAMTLNMSVNIVNPSYYQHLDQLLHKLLSAPNDSGKRLLVNYLGWRMLLDGANDLSKRYRDAKFEFDKVYTGVKEERPRWETCIIYTNSALKLAVGSIYVDAYFRLDAKAKLVQLVEAIKKAYEEILRNTSWMDDETRIRALKKLHAMNQYIAYPDFLLTDLPRLDKFYENYNISGQHFLNARNIDIQDSARAQQELITAVRRDVDEEVAPATVNAYYAPQKNIITFLAGVIQPPFFHKDYPMYLNYAALGQVFGHEMTHGFDDRGSRFDEEGKLSNWWSNASRVNYLSRARAMAKQYDQFNTVVGHVNGNLTSGENIADNGGVKEAVMAFKQYVSQFNESTPHLLPGLEGMPLKKVYFLASAQAWCGYYRPEVLRNMILTNVHSPNQFRVMGPLANLPDFAETFNCPAGSFMNPLERAGVW